MAVDAPVKNSEPTFILPKDQWPAMSVLKDKLLNARCRLMARAPWYGHIAMAMEWKPSEFEWVAEEGSRTMGVRIMSGGVVECLWYPGFVAGQSLKQLFGTIQHEIEHIVRCHCLRIGSGRDPQAWNIAADCTVNGRRSRPKFGYKEPVSSEVTLPLDGNLVWVPETWEDDQTAEFYYDKIYQDVKRCQHCAQPMTGKQQGEDGSGGKQGKGNKQGQGQSKGKSKGQGADPGQGQGQGADPGPSDSTCPCCGQAPPQGGVYRYGEHFGRQIDDHSVWSQTEVSQDEARQLVKNITDQATAKAKGDVPGHLQEALKQLAKPVVRWRELLRSYMGRHVGNRRMTYARRSRRHNQFGAPGVSHHAAGTVRVIVDTSGSIGAAELGQFFAEIDQIATRAKVMILQWDHAYQGYSKYRTGDWRRFKVNGRGGTDMAAPVRWLEENQQLGDCQIMLTDGYCNWPEQRGWHPAMGMIYVITSPASSVSGPGWGHEVRLKVGE